MRIQRTDRRGTAVVETAIVLPITLLILLATIVGGLGVFRYQEVALLAREGARYAAVHGTKYAQVSGNAAATASDVYTNAIAPKMVILDPSLLTYSVTWTPDNQPGGTVKVKVSYQWIPESFFSAVTLSSTASQTVSY